MTQHKTSILVLVHPGRLVGPPSPIFAALAPRLPEKNSWADLNGWTGPIIVVDHPFSDEIAEYPAYANAIDGALGRAKSGELITERVWGCDDVPPHQDEAIEYFVAAHKLQPTHYRFEVTGAWTTRGLGSGCVDSVAEKLRS